MRRETEEFKYNQYKNHLGIFSWFGYVMPLPERLQLIKNAGFTATTLWWEDEIGDQPIKKEDMPSMVRDYGLYLENIHVPYFEADDIWNDSKVTREKGIARHISWLEDCAKFDIPIMVMHIMAKTVPHFNNSGIQAIKNIIKKAEELKVTVALENLKEPEFLDVLFTEIQSEYLGLCYDSSHDWLYSSTETEILEKWGHLLVTTHLADNDGLVDRHWLPGEGIVDWEKVSRQLTANNYSGSLTLEAFPKDYTKERPEDFLKEARGRFPKKQGIK